MEKIKVWITKWGTIAIDAHPNPTGWNDVCKCSNCLVNQEIASKLKQYEIVNGSWPAHSIQYGEVVGERKIKIVTE